MKYTRFVIYCSVEGQYYFRLFNARDKLLLTGPTYTLRIQCIAAIHNLYTIVLRDEHYKIVNVTDGYKFVLVDKEQHKIAESEAFHTRAGLAYGMHAIKKNVCIAVIEDYSANVRYFTKDAPLTD